jgi:hypothetical protein
MTNPVTGSCSADSGLPAIDPSSLPACSPACNGAHCVPAAGVPAESQALFAACVGGFCVPDTLSESGEAKPASCTSVGGEPGACLSVCLPEVASNAASIPQATCATGELCMPCVDPVSRTSTGACELGASSACGAAADAGSAPAVDAAAPPLPCPYTGPALIDPSTLPACGGGAHCLPTADVQPAEATEFATCAAGYCVPDKVIEAGGNYVPPTCVSLAGSEGRCLNTVLPAVAAQMGLPQSTCDSDEVCVPCFNVLTQANTGACNTSCDPGPAEPPTMLAGCCGGLGTCMPSSFVAPSDDQFLFACSQTSGSDPGGDLCLPTEMMQPGFTPEPCEDDYFGITWYTGVCLSNCLNIPDASNLYQGSCDGVHTCVPCQDPNSGEPTGAPGC